MRVLYIVTSFARYEGDPHASWIVTLIGHLRQRGIEVEVLAPSFRGLGDHQVQGIPVHRFRYFPARWEALTHEDGAPKKVGRPLYAGMVAPYLVAGVWSAAKLASRNPYDLIHVHWPLPQALLGLAARWTSGGQLVATFYGAELHLARRLPVLKPALRFLARACDRTVAISSFTARQVEEMTGVRPVVIPYGAALEPVGDAAPFPERDATQGPRQILFAGRFIERKGLPVLLRAVAQVAGEREVLLHLVGEGHERLALARLAAELGIADRVRFHGWVSRETLDHLYRTCDLFVLPSVVDPRGDTEGLGVVLIEALRYRKPAIGSNVGGIPDVIEDGLSGLLVPPGDPAALAQAIQQVLDDPALARRLGEEGFRYVAEKFDWEHITDQVAGLYRSLLGKE
ncbi:MAG: glycosyltransferase family 4 protein [Anaerolineae bacterium]